MRGKNQRRKEQRTTLSPNSKSETLIEEHHYQVKEHEKILRGTQHDKGLIKELDELKEWRLETKTTQRVLGAILLGVITVTGGATTYAVTKLTEAVLSRPVVINTHGSGGGGSSGLTASGAVAQPVKP